MLFVKSGVTDSLLSVTGELSEKIKILSAVVDTLWLVDTVEEFIKSQNQIKESFIPQLPIEISIYKLCTDLSMSPAATSEQQPIKEGPDINGGTKDKDKYNSNSNKTLIEGNRITTDPDSNMESSKISNLLNGEDLTL